MEIREHIDLSAFRPGEYLRATPEDAIRDELKSYLAEYRFQLPEYQYKLVYSNGHLRDTYTYEPMLEKAMRSIESRELHNKNTSREEAEYQGIQNLDALLQNAVPGDRIIWVSPPGSEQDGYGNYGFVFSGIIERISEYQKHISMKAYRIEETSVNSYKNIISEVVGEQIQFNTPEEFLSQPFVLYRPETNPERLLGGITYSNKVDNKQFGLAMGVLEPLVKQFIDEVGAGSPKIRLKQLFYTIENLALQLNENISGLYGLSRALQSNREIFVKNFGNFKPPVTGGSCGSSDENESIEALLNRNIMNRLTGHVLSEILGDTEDEYGSLTFKCGECGGEHTRPSHVLLTVCPTKKTAMKKC